MVSHEGQRQFCCGVTLMLCVATPIFLFAGKHVRKPTNKTDRPSNKQRMEKPSDPTPHWAYKGTVSDGPLPVVQTPPQNKSWRAKHGPRCHEDGHERVSPDGCRGHVCFLGKCLCSKWGARAVPCYRPSQARNTGFLDRSKRPQADAKCWLKFPELTPMDFRRPTSASPIMTLATTTRLTGASWR